MATIPTLVPRDDELLERVSRRIYSVPQYSLETNDLAVWYWYVRHTAYLKILLNENMKISGHWASAESLWKRTAYQCIGRHTK